MEIAMHEERLKVLQSAVCNVYIDYLERVKKEGFPDDQVDSVLQAFLEGSYTLDFNIKLNTLTMGLECFIGKDRVFSIFLDSTQQPKH